MKLVDVGSLDAEGREGILWLSAEDGRRLPMRGFSAEVAYHVANFRRGDRTSTPTIYKMVQELAERLPAFLSEVEVYLSGDVFRANLHFQGRDNGFTLRNYRASDSIALAVFYDVPIRFRRDVWEFMAMTEGEGPRRKAPQRRVGEPNINSEEERRSRGKAEQDKGSGGKI